ncbi:MAG: sigma-70 family RNA polymerase sigma factor [Proteobacteria bacterium]|nr:sigma-70 family RNA polymerase sigma factor [Pseudomonadota bacterium]
MPAHEQKTDLMLMADAAKGDAEAFGILARRHGQYMFALAYRMLGDRMQAEDAVQDVLVKIWTSAPNWRQTDAKWTTWMHTVMVRHCLDMLRRRRPTVQADDVDLSDERPSPLRQAMDNQRRMRVAAALQTLPDQQRAAVVLTYYHGLSNAEVASVLGSTVRAVESLLVRGRKHLRDHIGQGWEEQI